MSGLSFLVFLLFIATVNGASTCSSTCGPICQLQGTVLLEGMADVPMNTTMPLVDTFTGFMPSMGDSGLCNSLFYEARIWDKHQGWIWVPGSALNIPGAGGNDSIYSGPILNGPGQGLCVLKHRFSMMNIEIARQLLEGKQIRLHMQRKVGQNMVQCAATFQIEGCPFSSNPNDESSGRAWQWTQAAVTNDIVNFYTTEIDKLPSVSAQTMDILLIQTQNLINAPPLEAGAGNYLIVNYGAKTVFSPFSQASVTVFGADIADPTGALVTFAVTGPPDPFGPIDSQHRPPQLQPGHVAFDVFDNSLSDQGIYTATNNWDFGRTGFALGPINGPGPDQTVAKPASCFTLRINGTVGIDRLRILSYDPMASGFSVLQGYTIASEMPIESGQTYDLQLCTCTDGVYVTPSCKSSCPIRCTLEGDLVISPSIRDQLMTTTCGNEAVYSHDEMTIDCNSVRYEVELFDQGVYSWVSGDQLMRIKDRGQTDIYSACYENSTTSCGLFQRFQDLPSARAVLQGHDIRVIVDSRRCYVQTHVAGCPTSWYGSGYNQSLPTLAAQVPATLNTGCPQSFTDFTFDAVTSPFGLPWTLTNTNDQGIAVFFARCSSVDDYISNGENVNMLYVMFGNGKGSGSVMTTARVVIESPDIRDTFTEAYTDFAFDFNVVNGRLTGNVSYFNDAPPTGVALGPFPNGGCVSVTIEGYQNLNKINVGSYDFQRNDLRSSFTVNSTMLAAGKKQTFNLCQCPLAGASTSMCPTSMPLVAVSSEGFFEEAIKSLPVQIALGTAGTILAVAVGIGLWCVIKKKSKSVEADAQYVKL